MFWWTPETASGSPHRQSTRRGPPLPLPRRPVCPPPMDCCPGTPLCAAAQVPKGHVWLQGDNATNSTDSRNYGPVPVALIRGRVILKARALRPSPCPPAGRPQRPARLRAAPLRPCRLEQGRALHAVSRKSMVSRPHSVAAHRQPTGAQMWPPSQGFEFRV